jgi:MFS family permease
MDGMPTTLISTDLRSDYGTPRFSDIFGRKSALLIAMSFFMVGNLLAGFSKTIIQVIVFRGYASFLTKSFF